MHISYFMFNNKSVILCSVYKLTDKRNAICGGYCIFADHFYIARPGMNILHQTDSTLSAVCIVRKFRAKRCCAAFG